MTVSEAVVDPARRAARVVIDVVRLVRAARKVVRRRTLRLGSGVDSVVAVVDRLRRRRDSVDCAAMVRGYGSGFGRGAWRGISSCNEIDSSVDKSVLSPACSGPLKLGYGCRDGIFTFWLFELRVASI
jgi:hypothetical protein